VRGGDKFQTESTIHMQYSTISSSSVSQATHTPYIPLQTAPLPNPSNRKQNKHSAATGERNPDRDRTEDLGWAINLDNGMIGKYVL